MRSRPLVLLSFSATLACMLSARVPAQGPIVSPAAYANAEAPGSSVLPWQASPSFQPSRWLAIHGDLGTSPRVFASLAFRRDGPAAPQAGTRSVDVEIQAGAAVPFDRPSWVFARNWAGSPTVVLPRQVVNIGPYAAAGQPAPFELRFLFATPVAYGGNGSFAYEVKLFGNTAAGLTAPVDAVASQAVGGFPGLPVGKPCVAGGQFEPMALGMSHGASGPNYIFGALVRNAPANAPVVLAFGSTNPNLAVPGLCGDLHTDLIATMLIGLTDANGLLAEPLTSGSTTFYLPAGSACFATPNTFANSVFYLQAHALDVQSTAPILIANSAGRQVHTPPAGAALADRITTLFTFDPDPAHPSALFLLNSIGTGNVTEFR